MFPRQTRCLYGRSIIIQCGYAVEAEVLIITKKKRASKGNILAGGQAVTFVGRDDDGCISITSLTYLLLYLLPRTNEADRRITTLLLSSLLLSYLHLHLNFLDAHGLSVCLHLRKRHFPILANNNPFFCLLLSPCCREAFQVTRLPYYQASRYRDRHCRRAWRWGFGYSPWLPAIFQTEGSSGFLGSALPSLKTDLDAILLSALEEHVCILLYCRKQLFF